MATSSRKSTTGKPVAEKVTLTGNKLEDFLPLLPAEEKLRQNAAAGEECTVDDFDGNRPTKATSINTVRADFLRYMILGGCEKSPVTTFGLRLIGAYVKFPDESLVLDLEATEIPTDIAVYRCAVPGFIELGRADVKSILLDGSNVGRFNASGISTTGSILLRHEFTSKEPVTLVGAGIGGDFDCCGGKFDAPESCLLCDGIVVQGPVFLGDGFEASGLVTFRGAKINGELTCPGGKFAKGIDLRNSEIRNNVWFIEKFESGASIILRNARIGGNLSCQGGTFLDPDNAIIANRARIDGDVDLGNIKSKGTIAFTGSEIGGDFMPQGAILQGTPALQLRNSIIGGTLIWRGLGFVDGEVDLSGTSCKTLNTGHTSWLRRRDKYREELRDTKTSNDDEEKKPVEYHTKLDNFTYE